MANSFYTKARQKFLDGGISWSSDTIKIALVDTNDYTVDIANHEFLSEISPTAIVAKSPAFTGKSSTDGVADADDVVLSSVSGDVFEALVIYKDTGVSATSPLIAYIDTATNLPTTPNGDDIAIVFSNTATKIFRI